MTQGLIPWLLLLSYTRVWARAGDMLDCPPDAGALKSFKKLLLLSLTTSMFFRLSR